MENDNWIKLVCQSCLDVILGDEATTLVKSVIGAFQSNISTTFHSFCSVLEEFKQGPGPQEKRTKSEASVAGTSGALRESIFKVTQGWMAWSQKRVFLGVFKLG